MRLGLRAAGTGRVRRRAGVKPGDDATIYPGWSTCTRMSRTTRCRYGSSRAGPSPICTTTSGRVADLRPAGVLVGLDLLDRAPECVLGYLQVRALAHDELGPIRLGQPTARFASHVFRTTSDSQRDGSGYQWNLPTLRDSRPQPVNRPSDQAFRGERGDDGG
jgi:hypothetical protein